MDPMNLCMGCMEVANGAPKCPSCGYVEGTMPESPMYLMPRTVLKEQYLVGRVVGHGGFGITYIGWDLELARKIAVKEYFPSGVAMRTHGTENVSPFSGNLQKDYEWGLERYLDEARVVARFHNHPNIVWVQQFFRANGTAYMVLEYLEGVTFEQFLNRHGGKVPWETALGVMMPVMDALREVHRTEILHRDISPDNVYILRSGQVKLIDFGAARYALGQASKNLSIILKEGYAPEEQYRSKGNQGPWTDVYATAATLYRAITGKIPPPALDRQRLDEMESPSSLGVAIPSLREQALLMALSIRAEDRFQEVVAFQKALMSNEAPAPVPTPVPTPQPDPVVVPPTPVPTPTKFPKWLIAAAAFVVLLVVAVAVKLGGGKAPLIQQFVAEPAQVMAGQPVTLRWSAVNAEYVTIDDVPGKQAVTGSAMVNPSAAREYRLVAFAASGTKVESTVKVVVQAAPPRTEPKPAQIVFRSDTATIRAGQSVTLTWSVTDADAVTINGQKVPNDGSATVTPKGTAEYTLVAHGLDGVPRDSTIRVEVGASGGGGGNHEAPPKPQPMAAKITQFTAEPQVVQPGQTITLSWSVANATSVQISPAPGRVAPSGRATVVARAVNLYILLAQGSDGKQVTSVVNVPVQSGSTPPPPPPGPRPIAWDVSHDHQGGILGSTGNRYEWAHCEGKLVLGGGRLKYLANVPNHGFDVAIGDITEIRTNKIPIRGYKAFHIKLRTAGNYNFISSTPPQAIVEAIQEKMR